MTDESKVVLKTVAITLCSLAAIVVALAVVQNIGSPPDFSCGTENAPYHIVGC